MAAGGEITADHQVRFTSERDGDDRKEAVVNILGSSAGEPDLMGISSW